MPKALFRSLGLWIKNKWKIFALAQQISLGRKLKTKQNNDKKKGTRSVCNCLPSQSNHLQAFLKAYILRSSATHLSKEWQGEIMFALICAGCLHKVPQQGCFKLKHVLSPWSGGFINVLPGDSTYLPSSSGGIFLCLVFIIFLF